MNKARTLMAMTTAAAAVLAVIISAASTTAAPQVDTEDLRDAVTTGGIQEHLNAFQAAADADNDERVAGDDGHEISAEYVADRAEAAGYDVTLQEFDFPFFQETAEPILEQTSPEATVYVKAEPVFPIVGDFATMDYSGSGDVTASLQAVDLVLPPGAAANTSTSGCETSDFGGFTAGNIALMQRGTCSFAQKAANAEAAGAVGAIIFNEGQAGRTDVLFGTLGGPGVNIPTVGIGFSLGESLAGQLTDGDDVMIHMQVTAISETRTTHNVIAESPGGQDDRVVVVGAHLDGVPGAEAINDNGSGSATILEIAEEIAELEIEPRNKLRFIWFSAEEQGLLGSEFYVSQLTTREIKDIQVMLNFDMVGSPNFVRFVYDGDGSATPVAGPNGSDVVEDVFNDYFASQSLATDPTAFDGRSDYGPFIAVGIPAGGLFTGAEGVKTVAQAATYGGTAGVPYDPCYHSDCDDISNPSTTALDQMSDAAAHATLTFAMTNSVVNGTAKGNSTKTTEELEFHGPKAQQ